MPPELPTCRGRLRPHPIRTGLLALVLVLGATIGVARSAAAALPQLRLTVPTGTAQDFRCPETAPSSRGTPDDRPTYSSAQPDEGATFSLPAPGTSAIQGPWLHPDAAHPLRVAIWGDSHMAGGAFRQELAQVIEARSLAVRQSMIPINLTQHGIYVPVRAACAPATDWYLAAAYRSPQPVAVGLSLAALRSVRLGSRLWLDLRDADRSRAYDRLSVRYSPALTDVVLGITSDNTPEQIVRLPARSDADPSLAELLIQTREALGVLRIRVISGGFDLQGLGLLSKSTAPTITIDVFGLSSSTIHGWAEADPATLTAALTGSGYDAVILAYGTNEGAAAAFDARHYEADLRQALQVLRQVFPSQPCLLLGPPDRGVLWSSAPHAVHNEPYFYARRHQVIAAIQQRVGGQYACSTWDWQAVMGGPGSSYGWSRATPAYMQRDLTHLTSLGYRWSAQELARFLRWLP